jgi:hypothetical protein
VQVTPAGLRLGRGLGGEIMTACVRQDPRSYGPHHISMLLYGLAALGLRPPRSWLTHLLYQDGPQHMAARSSQDLSLLVYCLGALRVRPPAPWLGLVLDEVGGGVGTTGRRTSQATRQLMLTSLVTRRRGRSAVVVLAAPAQLRSC